MVARRRAVEVLGSSQAAIVCLVTPCAALSDRRHAERAAQSAASLPVVTRRATCHLSILSQPPLQRATVEKCSLERASR